LGVAVLILCRNYLKKADRGGVKPTEKEIIETTKDLTDYRQ